MKQTLVNGAASALGVVISYAIGEWSELMSFFLLAVAIDYVTGVAASIFEGKGLSSAIGSKGLARKGLMLLVIILAHRMDVVAGTNVVMMGAVYFYLANELISITENYGRLGLPLPDVVKRVIAVIKERSGADESR